MTDSAGMSPDQQDESFLAEMDARLPGTPSILARLSEARLRLGQTEAALATADLAVAAGPEDGAAHAARGQAMRALKRMPEARAELETAVRLAPGYALGWLWLAEVLAGFPDSAVQAQDALRHALRLAPRDPRCHAALAAQLMAQSKHDEALNAYRAAILVTRDPNPADLLNNLGVALERLERREEAVQVLRTATMIRPESPAIFDNLGNALLSTGAAPEAEIAHRRALGLGARGPETWSNLGNALHRQGRLDEAEAAYRKAIEANPNAPKFHTNLALNLLLSGRFAEGWREYEWRWRDHPGLPAYLKDRVWDGGPLGAELPAGGTLLLQAEQGFGDTIQFIRYVPLIKARGVARVILACQPELMRLVESAPGLDQVVSELGPLPPFDRALTLLTLAGIFEAGDKPIPAETPYLRLPPGAGVSLPEFEDDAFKVGLAWAGRPTHGDDWNRSMPARLLGPLLAVPGTRFYSLQRGPVSARLGRPAPGAVVEAGDLCSDFADTAHVVAAMDMIISVDTAVVHLAGALGKPVLVMLPGIPDFRWGLSGELTPWYRNLRLLRRPLDGGWETVVSRAVELLQDAARARASNNS